MNGSEGSVNYRHEDGMECPGVACIVEAPDETRFRQVAVRWAIGFRAAGNDISASDGQTRRHPPGRRMAFVLDVCGRDAFVLGPCSPRNRHTCHKAR